MKALHSQQVHLLRVGSCQCDLKRLCLKLVVLPTILGHLLAAGEFWRFTSISALGQFRHVGGDLAPDFGAANPIDRTGVGYGCKILDFCTLLVSPSR